MAKAVSFTKRSLITKANSNMVTAAAVAAFLVAFALVSSKTLVGQMAYQNRVLGTKRTALKQLKADLTARDSLETSYQTFVSAPANLIGGSPNGTGPQDGDNGKIILDALPSQYDFPALVTSLQALVNRQGLQILSVNGTDQELSQQSASTSATAPQPVAMPFQLQVSGSYQAVQGLISMLESSIRPFQVQTLLIAGNSQNSVTATIGAQTYYQPGVTLKIGSEVVK